MHQIRALTFALFMGCTAAAAQTIREEMIACADLADAADRLSCYDRASRSTAPTKAKPSQVSPQPAAPAPARPAEVSKPSSTVAPPAVSSPKPIKPVTQPARTPSPPAEPPSQPTEAGLPPVEIAPQPVQTPPQPSAIYSEDDEVPARREAASYLRGTRRMGDQLQLTLIDSQSGEPLPDWAFEELEKGGAALDDMRGQADFIMALPASPESEEAAVFTVACRAGITEMRFFWPEPFSGQRVQVRLRRAENIGEIVTMRIKGDGFVFEAPRGLEAIRLIRGMVQAPRIQVLASGQGSGRPRSAYFEMKDMRTALGLQARICSWSGS